MNPKPLLGLALVLSGGWCRAEFYTNLNSEILLKAILTNVWDYSRPFSGVAAVSFLDDPPMTLNIGICSQGGNIRLYVDRGEAVSGPFPLELAKRIVAERKREGENRYFILFREGDPNRYQIFPDRRGYHTNAFVSLLPFMEWTNPVTIQQMTAEAQTVNGHLCRKIDWRMSVNDESDVFASVWRANDLGDFPMRLKIKNAVEITFTQTKFGKVDPALFEIPADYHSLDAMEAAPSASTPVRAAPTKEEMYARILKSHQELADKGDAYGELRMGLRYRDGDGVPKDLDKARDYLQKAADQGDLDAAKALTKLPKPKEVAPPASAHSIGIDSDIVLKLAEFGMGKKVADVTDRVGELLRSETEGFTADAKTLGADPLPGKKKHLVVKYDYQGTNYVLTLPAGKHLDQKTLANNAAR